MQWNARERPASLALAGEAKRWRFVAIPFALGLILGGGIGCSALFLPVDVPGEAQAAALHEASAAVSVAEATAADARSAAAALSAGSWALDGPVERLSAPAVATRKVWWKMPGFGAAPLAVGSAH